MSCASCSFRLTNVSDQIMPSSTELTLPPSIHHGGSSSTSSNSSNDIISSSSSSSSIRPNGYNTGLGVNGTALVPVLGYDAMEYLSLVVAFLLVPLNVLGVMTNGVNVLVFFRQGLRDSINLSLACLALVDMVACVCLLPHAACWLVRRLGNLVLFCRCVNATFLYCFFPHIVCSKMASCVTVYLSVERALCVLMPLKVKIIFRLKTAIVSMALIPVLIVPLYTSIAVSPTVLWSLVPDPNGIAAVNAEGASSLRTDVAASIILTLLSVLVVLAATGLMAHRLHRHRRWRKMALARPRSRLTCYPPRPSLQNIVSQRSKEIELLKIVSMVTVVYVVCLLLSHAPVFILTKSARLPGDDFMLVISVKSLLDSVNANINFFGYMRMSSKYKLTFKQVFSFRLRE